MSFVRFDFKINDGSPQTYSTRHSCFSTDGNFPLVLLDASHGVTGFNIPLWSFGTIVAGSIGCVWGGLALLYQGSAKVAAVKLTDSGIYCLLSPLVFFASLPVLLLFLIL